jgi:hypothetical protein
MLIFFIHGVATRDVKYSQPLAKQIKDEISNKRGKLPYFYTSFWGHVLNDFNQIWNNIDDDLNLFKDENPAISTDEVFRYRQVREGLISEFVGDMLTYMNQYQGYEVRRLIAQQLQKFLEKYSDEQELHIISHSLGTVILWDILFSDNFEHGDPAFIIRDMISKSSTPEHTRKTTLKSITTMGSPIPFFNTTLDVKPETIKKRIEEFTDEPIKWLNIIHSSDIIAYPFRSSLGIEYLGSKLEFSDLYINEDANLLEAAARKINQQEIALATAMANAHTSYWTSPKVAQLISGLVTNTNSILEKVLKLLEAVPGIAKIQFKLHSNDDIIETIEFRDSSGRLTYFKNFANVYHIYVYDSCSKCVFSGYIDWFRTDLLLDEVEHIRFEYGKLAT